MSLPSYGYNVKLSVGNKAPKNLYHFIMDNGVYATTGGQDTPAANRASFPEMAQGAGYSRCYQFDDLEEFASQAADVLSSDGPVLVCVKTVPSIRKPEDNSSPSPTRESHQTRPQAITNLLEEFGAEDRAH